MISATRLAAGRWRNFGFSRPAKNCEPKLKQSKLRQLRKQLTLDASLSRRRIGSPCWSDAAMGDAEAAPVAGTILWAQASGYPFWPAQVMSADATAEYAKFLSLPGNRSADFAVRKGSKEKSLLRRLT